MNLNVSDWKGKQGFLELVKSNEPKLVLFSAHWCGYSERFLKVARSYEPSYNTELVLVDTDDPDESLWDEYKIRVVPTLVVFESGKETFRKEAVPGPGLREAQLVEALSILKGGSRSS